MRNFGWVDSLLKEPGVDIQRFTTRGQVAVVIRSRRKAGVYDRRRHRHEFRGLRRL